MCTHYNMYITVLANVYIERLYFVFDANTLNNNIDSVNLGIYTTAHRYITAVTLRSGGNIVYR